MEIYFALLSIQIVLFYFVLRVELKLYRDTLNCIWDILEHLTIVVKKADKVEMVLDDRRPL